MKSKRNPVAAFCSSLGTLLLIVIVLACLPLTVPRVFGYQIYTVISGSMEPQIPTGSLVYIGPAVPADISEGDVIAFYGAADSASIITHRVVENRTVMGEFITKGDANESADMNPVPYDELIGKVTWSVPYVGIAAQLLSDMTGKAAAASLIGLAVVLLVLAAVLDSYGRKK